MECASTLLVMPGSMQQEFGRLAAEQCVEWRGVETCRQAREALAENPSICVVVSNDTLPDGSWYSLLHELVRKGSHARLLVVVPEGHEAKTIRSYGISGVLSYPVDPSAGELIADAALEAGSLV